MGSIAEAIIKLELENKDLKAKLGESMAHVDKFKGKMGSAGSSLKKNWMAVVATVAVAVAAIKQVSKVIIDSVKAVFEAERAQKGLEDSLKRQTVAYKEVGASLKEFADAQQKETRFGAEETKTQMAEMIALGVRHADVIGITTAAMDLAAATHKDLGTATDVLMRAYNGQVEGLRKFGINIESTGNKGKDFENVLKLIRTQMGGLEEAEGETLSGKWAIMINRIGQMKEALGLRLMPKLIEAFNWWDKLLTRVEKSLETTDPMNTQLAAVHAIRQEWQKTVLLAKEYQLTGGKFVVDDKGITVAITYKEKLGGLIKAYKELNAEEILRLKTALDPAMKKAYEDRIQQMENLARGEIKVAEAATAQKKAETDAILEKEERIRKLKETSEMYFKFQEEAEEKKVTWDMFNNDLASQSVEANKSNLNRILSDENFTYSQRLQYLNAYYATGKMLEADYNMYLLTLQKARQDEWIKEHALEIEIAQGAHTAIAESFENEFVKNIGTSIDKVNLNFNNLFDGIWQSMLKFIAKILANSIAIFILDLLTGGFFSTALSALNASPVKLFNKGGEVKGYASGGDVSGPGGTDKVPAMLTAGEYVINKRATEMYRPLLDSINYGRQKFATGGAVGSTNSRIVTINAPITVTGGLMSGELAERRIAKEIGDVLKRQGII